MLRRRAISDGGVAGHTQPSLIATLTRRQQPETATNSEPSKKEAMDSVFGH